jgi:putative MFS transporter
LHAPVLKVKLALMTQPDATMSPGNSSASMELWVWITVLVAALGYFVDVVDLWLFSNLRVASLRDLGLSGEDVTNTGAFLLNTQQAGLLIGSIIWGVMGDRRGRASVMFGSIFLYSVGNILNSFVTTIPQYAALRFITGVGLAGEIGAGITLVCEILPKDKRGIGTTFVTGLGVAGAILAALMGKYLAWRTAFFVGGCMGLALFLLRVFTHDSGLFERMRHHAGVRRGSLGQLIGSRDMLVRFISCIASGMPIYLTFSIFAVFSPELAPAIGIHEPIVVADVMLCVSVGLTLGDLLAGLLSQLMRRRKTPLVVLVVLNCVVAMTIVSGAFASAFAYLVLVGLLGLTSGYWACLITTAAEQFGTNIRATVTTMVPNLVRAMAIPITIAFVEIKNFLSIQNTVWVVTSVVFACAFWGLSHLRESFHTDLDFYER